MTTTLTSPTQTPMASPPAAPRPRPIIEAENRYSGDKRDIVLWPEPRKNISEERYAAMTDREITALNSMRDLHGYITIHRSGSAEHRIGVSAWLSNEENQPVRIKLMGDLNSGQSMLGSIRAMTRRSGGPADGERGLVLIGDLDLALPNGREKVTITGQVNGRFPDRELMIDAARVFGFPDQMIGQYVGKIDRECALRARAAVADASQNAMKPTMG